MYEIINDKPNETKGIRKKKDKFVKPPKELQEPKIKIKKREPFVFNVKEGGYITFDY